MPDWSDSLRTDEVMGVGRQLLDLRETSRTLTAAVWADALEEAGCESAFWLNQLRDPQFRLLDQHGPAVWLKAMK